MASELAWRMQEDGYLMRINDLEAKNCKLRKLVGDLWDFFCVVPDEPHVFKEELDFSVEIWRRMQELGIGV